MAVPFVNALDSTTESTKHEIRNTKREQGHHPQRQFHQDTIDFFPFVRDADSVPSKQVAWHIDGHSYISWLSSILSIPVQPKVTPNSPALRLKRDLEELIPIEKVHATRNEGEIVAATRNSELSNQDA